ncbi:MAG: citryl-CoA lyase [Planctomycetota bacterium]|nr:MAG: citryl-CoA lyase [Planctomycetota bacterium]
MPEPWPTAITKIEPNRVAVRGYDIADLMGRASFGEAVHLLLTGDLPDPAVGRLIDAILVSSVDHGATPPSALAARTVASTGASLSQAVAAGVLAINESHGGAIEGCAHALSRVIEIARLEGDVLDAAARVIDEYKADGRRIPGFGHRLHTADPRTARLFALANEADLYEEADATPTALDAARALERAFAQRGKAFPINVDGAIAAVLLDLGYDPGVMNGLFIIARSAGLVAHAREEQTRMPRMRRIDPVNHTYDGPPDRRLER